MRKQKNAALWLCKVFLVILMVFSQLYAPTLVLAEELSSDDVTDNISTDDESKVTDNNENITSETSDVVMNDDSVSQNEDTTGNTSLEGDSTKEDTTEDTSLEGDSTKEDTTEDTSLEGDSTKEDTTEPEKTDVVDTEKEVTVVMNGEETDNYSLKNGEETVQLVITYGDIVKNETLDFSKKLAGTYQYHYTVGDSDDSKELDVTVSNLNTDITIFNDYFIDKSFIMSPVKNENGEIFYQFYLRGNRDGFAVDTFLDNFDKKKFSEDYSLSDMVIKCDKESSIITNFCHLEMTGLDADNETSTIIYPGFKIFGDYTSDGMVNEEDAEFLVYVLSSDDSSITNTDQYDVNGDGEFNILDASHHVFSDGSWEEYDDLTDELLHSFINKTNFVVGDEVAIKYHIDGFDKNFMNAFSGKLNYNKELLELSNVEFSIDPEFGMVDDEDRFYFLFKEYKTNGLFITFTFEAISDGDANISLDNLLMGCSGKKLDIDSSIMTDVTIISDGKGGDVAPSIPDVEEQTPVSSSVPQVVREVENVYTPSTRYVDLSSDSLIKSLEVKGYDIKFDPNTFEYSLKVKNNVTSLDLSIVLSDANATYVVNGNENFKVGENTVSIVVTAPDGSTSTYKIHVTREKAENKKGDVEEEEEKSNSKVIIIILIILVIIGLIYVIFKDDEEDKESNK